MKVMFQKHVEQGRRLNYIKNNVIRIAYFFIIGLALSACSSLPEHLLNQVERMPAVMSQHQALIEQEKNKFDGFSADKEWGYIRPYLEKEKWAEYFNRAANELSAARSYFESDVLSLAEKNDPQDATRLTVNIVLFNEKIAASLASAQHAAKRADFLIRVRDTAAAIHKNALLEFSALKKARTELTAKAEKAIAKYAHKKSDINKRLDELELIVNKGAVSVRQLVDEFKKKDNVDFALFGDASVALSDTLQQVLEYQNKTAEKLDELYRSYTKVLADQKIQYFIDIGRASWCEGEYCGNGRTKVYPSVQVDKNVFKYFDELNQDLIASYRWNRLSLKIPGEIWQALRINEKWNWSRGDSHADYWVQKTYTKTFHKYVEIVNDKMSEGEWLAVDEDSFWQQFDNLGMSILTKPYGYYEEDSLKDAQPVGMAAIAKPTVVNGVATGSNQYGSWQQGNGGSFWQYYGMYRMFGDLMGPSRRYYYNDWSGYNNNRSGSYYGRNNEYGTWGSGTYNNSRYRNSGYARSNPDDVGRARSGKTAGYRSAASVRGAGASSRSRGPAGGGK